MEHGDFERESYQSRYMNRRFKQYDSFSKVIPTYHHSPESSYCNNQSQSHRAHREFMKDDVGRNIADIDLSNFKKVDFLQSYAHMINTMPDLAPKPRKQILNSSGHAWKINVMHSMWPVNSIYGGKYQSGDGTGNQL